MENIYIILILSLFSYLLGSMMSSVWIGKLLYGVDVREFGSGNAGATNTFRVLGKKAGFLVLFMDVFKGFGASSLVFFLPFLEPDSVRYVNVQLLFGLFSVLGHIFPVYGKFKGGKGIATLLGMVIGIHYLSALACIALFAFILILTRYVSLSSIIASMAFPLFLIFLFKSDEPLFVAFGVSAAILVILTHQKNIKRLVSGNENKANISIRKKRRMSGFE